MKGAMPRMERMGIELEERAGRTRCGSPTRAGQLRVTGTDLEQSLRTPMNERCTSRPIVPREKSPFPTARKMSARR